MEGKTIRCAVHKTEDQTEWGNIDLVGKEGNLKREMEVLIFAAKYQEVQMNYIKGIIDKSHWLKMPNV